MQNYRDKRVVVMGLGLHGGGVSAARFFAEQGANVTVTDLRDAATLAPSVAELSTYPIRFVLGQHRKRDILGADLIVKNPGVPNSSPYLALARKHDIPITSDAALFLEETEAFIVGVTGTKGKTTTATLVERIFTAHDINTTLVGTPSGPGFLDALTNAPKVTVCEFSSWDLEAASVAKRSPHVAVITNLFEDHLDRHESMEEYAKAKSVIFQFQSAQDILAYPQSETAVADLCKDAPGQAVIVDNERVDALPNLAMLGAQNRILAALAIAAAEAATTHPFFPTHTVFDPNTAVRTVAEFKGLPGRLEVIGINDERTFINDTTATNPLAAVAALSAVQGPLILIAGGEMKTLDVTPFVEAIAAQPDRIRFVAFLPGSASDAIRQGLIEHGYNATSRDTMDMEDAFDAAFTASVPGDTILLSPGAASLNVFKNEFERGKHFKDAYVRLAGDKSMDHGT